MSVGWEKFASFGGWLKIQGSYVQNTAALIYTSILIQSKTISILKIKKSSYIEKSSTKQPRKEEKNNFFLENLESETKSSLSACFEKKISSLSFVSFFLSILLWNAF